MSDLPSAPDPSSADRTVRERTTGLEALRRLERRLIPARTTAGQVESWIAYRREWVPEDLAPSELTSTEQGFAAGYDAAMDRVRSALAETQTEVLREER